MPAPTPPFTTGNDFINIYETKETSGAVGHEVNLNAIGNTYQMGLGVDEIYMDASYSRLGDYFNISATETGMVTITNASGGTVKVAGAERLQFTNLTINLGTAASEVLNGSTGSDKFLFGLNGNDTINGLGGSDTLMGGNGNDTLDGGSGIDLLQGGKGKDTLIGGTEADTFDFNKITDMSNVATKRDIITDFKHAEGDKIDLLTIDADSITTGNQKFTLVAGSVFHNVAGELIVVQEDLAGTANDKTIVMGDIDGVGGADFHIQLTGLINLVASDFIL